MKKGTFTILFKSLKSDSLPLSVLGVIEGILEEYADGEFTEAYDCIDQLNNVMQAFKEVYDERWTALLKEPHITYRDE